MRVLYLDHTAKWSGGEIALWRTLSALDRERVEPLVVLAEDGPFVGRLAAFSLPTEVLPLAAGARELRKDRLGAGGVRAARTYLRYVLALTKLIRARRIDLIHCNSLKADIYGGLAGKLAGRPVIWHVRDHIDPGYLPGKVVRVFRTLATALPAAVITNSESTRETLFPQGVGRQRCQVVYDGLMASELTSPRPAASSQWRMPPRLGLVGRITRWKGQHVFLEAARLLTEQGIAAQYQLIGAPLFDEQNYEAELHRQAAPLGERVSFLGFRDDIPALLRGLDILVHCSISPEPFGQVVVEGMAEGVPVVASDGGGVREIIVPGVSGLRTPMGDAPALATALAALLREPATAATLGQGGYDRVREKFTAELSARGVESVYRALLGDQ